MMPGMDGKALKGVKLDEKAMARTEAIILSMTPYERENPEVIGAQPEKAHRRRRWPARWRT